MIDIKRSKTAIEGDEMLQTLTHTPVYRKNIFINAAKVEGLTCNLNFKNIGTLYIYDF